MAMGLNYYRTLLLLCLVAAQPLLADETQRTYSNQLIRINHAKPLLADYPQFVAPIEEKTRFEAPALVDDPGADLHVRAW